MNTFEKANINETKTSRIFNSFTDLEKGYDWKSKEDKYKVDLILQRFRETVLECELEFTPYDFRFFLKKREGITIPYRKRKIYDENPNVYYLRIVEIDEKFNEKSYTYLNSFFNIEKLPTIRKDNRFQKNEKFFSDDLTTEYKGFCESLKECLREISTKSGLLFFKEQRGDLKKWLPSK